MLGPPATNTYVYKGENHQSSGHKYGSADCSRHCFKVQLLKIKESMNDVHIKKSIHRKNMGGINDLLKGVNVFQL